MTISLDADLQDDIDVIDQMVEKYYAGNDVVYGVRSARKTDTFFKKFTAQGFYKMMQAMGVDIVYNHADYRLMSRRALEEMDGMYGAKVGDKTMMDAVIPASQAIAAYQGEEAEELFAAAAQASAQGAENSKQFVSKFGRAKSYGEKTIGTPDAGAMSMSYFFQGLAGA